MSAVATFRAADVPRALASRLVAAAVRHPGRGWTVTFPDTTTGSVRVASFEAAVSVVTARTGVDRLLIVWSPSAPADGQAEP